MSHPRPASKEADLVSDAFRQNVERLQAVMAQTPLPMALFVGDQLRVPAHNALMREIWDKTTEEIGDRPLLAFLPELIGQGFDDLLRGVLRTGETYEGKELPVRFLRGGQMQDFYFNFIYSLYCDEAGRPIGVLSVATDVTALVLSRHEIGRQVAERTAQLTSAKLHLETQHTQLQRTFEQAPVGIFSVKGEELVYELANPLFCQLINRRVDECLGYGMEAVLPELEEQGFIALMRQVIRTGEPLIFNDAPVILMRDGREETRYFTFSYQPSRTQNGEVKGLIGFAVEVTEQHLHQERLAASEVRFRNILESMPHMSWTHQPDGSSSFLSQRWAEYSGTPLDDIAAYERAEMIHPDDRDPGFQLYRDSLTSGQPFTNEQRIRRADGAYRWHLNRAVPLYDDDGTIRLWVGTATDIHDLREAQSQLLELSAEVQDTNAELNARNRELASTNLALKRSNADMDSFVYTASHDLKAPITNIQGLHEMLREELADQHTGVEPILDMVDSSLERFMQTLKDLGEIARLQTAAEAPKHTPLKTIVADVLLDCGPMLAAAGGRVVDTVDGDCEIFVSHKNLRSVVYNLVSNAIKYRSLDRSLEVQISCVTEGEFDVLSVRDNGLGMDLSGDHKLFTMFYRMHDHVEGSGVGLHIVKKIMDNLGGHLEVKSAPGVGTTFRAFFKSVTA